MALLTKKTATLTKGLDVHIDPKKPYVTFKVDGKSYQVKRIDLYTLTYLIADANVQDQLLPVRKEEMMEFRREHTVQLKRNMGKGELLNITCKVHVPTRVVEGIMAAEKEPRKPFKLLGHIHSRKMTAA